MRKKFRLCVAPYENELNGFVNVFMRVLSKSQILVVFKSLELS